ncbi:prolyl oligopeptidase family serine peptidase [Flagellimonas sp.]|uniref:carboxylesterase family protein n=1 Tax=Flagellimonas sp. TaxID=2058762 RepID=UPI003F4A0FA0
MPNFNPISKAVLVICFLVLNACQSQSRLISGELTTRSEENLKYYLYYPEGYDSNPDDEFGILLFLHGGGESGGSLDDLTQSGPPKMLVEGKQFPFLVLAPQNPHKKKWWNTRALIELLDDIIKNNRIDSKRIYLSGLSRGGSAAWNLAVQYPEKFAAMAVVCGMTPVPYAHWIDKNMPIWVFHGDQDQVIPVSESDTMVKKLKSMGYSVQYTRYEGVGHNSWVQAYTTEELYTWLANQKRK